MTPGSDAKRHNSFRNGLVNFGILLLIPVATILMTTFVIQPFKVSGQSMQSTLQNGDRLLVDKASKNTAALLGKEYLPNRGDIIIFTGHSDNPAYQEVNGKVLIKRVIGLPGDHIVIGGGHVTIYNYEHPSGFDPDAGTKYISDIGITPWTTDLTVLPGHVFVMGDNRKNSTDSRFIGPVSTDAIIGKLALRIGPIDKTKLF